MKVNIVKYEVYTVSPFMEILFGVFVGNVVINVDIATQKCTCRGWEMSGIPSKHACATTMYLRQNIVDFADDVFKCSTQEKVYSCMFHGIEIPDMPKVDDDGVIRDVVGNIYLPLKPPQTK